MKMKVLPLCRYYGMVFNVFRALSSGILVGQFVKGEHIKLRFNNIYFSRKFVYKLFNSEDSHVVMKRFDEGCAA